MDVPNYYLVQKVHELRKEELARRDSRHHHLSMSGVDQRGMLAVWGCALLSGTGSLLMMVGQRLKRAAGAPVISPKRLPRVSGA